MIVDYTQCIKALCSKLGIDVISETTRKNGALHYEIHHTGKFLGNCLRLDLNAWSLLVSATQYLSVFNPMLGYSSYPLAWTDSEGCNNLQSRYMLECIIASRAFKIADKHDLMIGNPFYCKFQLLDCTSEDEFLVCLDLLAIDKKDENIKIAMKLFKTSSKDI